MATMATFVLQSVFCVNTNTATVNSRILFLTLVLCFGNIGSNGQAYGPALEWRLTGGTVPNEGRLEVRLEQPDSAVWHTICSTGSSIIPKLICGELGWPFSIPCSIEIPASGEPPVTDLGEILTIFALCRNDIQSLSECDTVNIEVDSGSCQHDSDVWISCLGDTSDMEVRLVDGLYPGDGYVQTRCPQPTSEWLAVCPDNWDRRDANVVCKQLGFAFAYGIDAGGTLTTNLGDFAFNNVYCTGEENTFGDCELVNEQPECFTAASTKQAEVSCAAYYEVSGILVPLCGTHSCKHPLSTNPFSNTRQLCKCDCACVAFNDCCPDFDASIHCTEGNPSDLIINGVDIEYYDCIEVPGSEQYNYGFSLVGKCPKSWTDVNTRINCEVARDPTDIVGLLPVNDANKVAYKNIFCAQCHGKSIGDITFWTLEAQCQGPCPLDPSIGLPIPSGPGAGFTVTWPSEDLRPRSCPAHFIETCPPNVTDKQLISACSSYFAPFALTPNLIYPEYPQPYRNPHCALCNGVPETLFTEICYDCIPVNCPSSAPKDECRAASCPRGVHFLTVEALFNFNSFENDEYGQTTSCEVGTAYDPFLKMCRSLSCPPDFVLVDETCQPLNLPDPRVNETEIIGSDFSIKAFDCIIGSMGLNSPTEAGIIQAVTSELHKELISCIVDDIGCVTSGTSVVSVTLLFQNDKKLVNFINALKPILEDNADGFPLCNITSVTTYISYSLQFALPSYCNEFKSNMSKVLNVNTASQVLLNYGKYEFNATSVNYTSVTPSSSCLVNTFLNCTFTVALNQSEFTMNTNDSSVFLVISNTTVGRDEHIHLSDGTIQICSTFEPPPPVSDTRRSALDIIAAVCGWLSVIALLATFITYLVFAPLRNLAGKAVMNLVFALLLGYLGLLLAGFFLFNDAACSVCAIVTHYVWIAAFSWMMLFAFNIARTFSRRGVSTSRSGGSFWKYMIIGWTIPAVVVAISLGLHYCECTSIDFRYGNPAENSCFLHGPKAVLFAFVIPISVLLLLSVSFFLFMAVQLRQRRSASRMARTGGTAEEIAFEAIIYLRLSAVIGATWIFAYLFIFLSTNSVISYIYIILNSLQGVFIFLAFGITGRVRAMWRDKYNTMTSHGKSTTGTASTPLKPGHSNSNSREALNNVKVESSSKL